MESTPTPTFNTLSKKISDLPLWIKQVIYLQLKENFEDSSTWGSLNLFNKEDCIQLYIPKITFIGKKELETRSRGLALNVYKFLMGASQNLNIMDIAISNNWSLSECSGHFLTSFSAELVKAPDSICISSTASYLCDKARIGEYFVKLGKVNLDQLNETLKAQKYIQDTLQDKLMLGEILIDLGLATKTEIEGIILLKEESKKKYISDIFAPDESNSSDQNVATEISLLKAENAKLKERLHKILKVDH